MSISDIKTIRRVLTYLTWIILASFFLAFINCGAISEVKRQPNKTVTKIQPKIKLGIDVLKENKFSILKGKRVGLITNPSGVDSGGRSTLEILFAEKSLKLVALFCAEHGLDGKTPAGKEIANYVDQKTGLPVFSLYGPGPIRKPTLGMLRNIDVLVYDIQDTGCRSYTFISTMGLAMEACAEADVEFVVLDRPNPLGGVRIEGPLPKPNFRSFVSQWDIPYVYGLTCGELALMINNEGWIKKPCKLKVVKMQGWKRTMVWKDTGLRWIPTSPNIPYGHSPMYYVSTGILGSMGALNIGIGTAHPFEVVGASWLKSTNLATRLNQLQLNGIKFYPTRFYNGSNYIPGIRFEFLDPVKAPLMPLNFYIMESINKLHNRNLYLEALNSNKNFSLFDKIMGSDEIRSELSKNVLASQIVKSWKQDEDKFRVKRQKYLLY
jgi:uncharacterized protein YbbC (DUF1343 family)